MAERGFLGDILSCRYFFFPPCRTFHDTTVRDSCQAFVLLRLLVRAFDSISLFLVFGRCDTFCFHAFLQLRTNEPIHCLVLFLALPRQYVHNFLSAMPNFLFKTICKHESVKGGNRHKLAAAMIISL